MAVVIALWIDVHAIFLSSPHILCATCLSIITQSIACDIGMRFDLFALRKYFCCRVMKQLIRILPTYNVLWVHLRQLILVLFHLLSTTGWHCFRGLLSVSTCELKMEEETANTCFSGKYDCYTDAVVAVFLLYDSVVVN